jgi:hypothetical protein
MVNAPETVLYVGAGIEVDFIKAISTMKIKGKPMASALKTALSCLIIEARTQMLVSIGPCLHNTSR